MRHEPSRLTRSPNEATLWQPEGKTWSDAIPYTIKPKTNGGFGSFAVLAGDAHEALGIAKGMAERGIEKIEILDDSGAACDPVELERIASKETIRPFSPKSARANG